VRRCLTIAVIIGQPPSTCPPAWRPRSARSRRGASPGGWRRGRCRGRGCSSIRRQRDSIRF
jgi:hypothetical protein